MLEKIVGDTRPDVMTVMATALRKVFRRLYDDVIINTDGLERVQSAVHNGPIVYLPTHRSYIDFLVVSYMV